MMRGDHGSRKPKAYNPMWSVLAEDTRAGAPELLPDNRARIALDLDEAIRRSAQTRTRSAVLLIELQPSLAVSPQPDFLQGVAQRIPRQPHEPLPLAWDDFTLALCCCEFQSVHDVLERARFLVTSLTHYTGFGGYPTGVHCTIGIGMFPEDGDCAQALLRAASAALADLRVLGGDAAGLCLRRTPDAPPVDGTKIGSRRH